MFLEQDAARYRADMERQEQERRAAALDAVPEAGLPAPDMGLEEE